MHKVEFYFDPSCPFSWITSRWLTLVEAHRNIDISWQPFSLAIKNNQLDKLDGDQYTKTHLAAHRMIRVMHSAATNHGVHMGKMYSFVGYQHHVKKEPFDERMIDQLIVNFGLRSDLIEEADNPDHDEQLNQSIKRATSVTGENVGVPIILFLDKQKPNQGYFGPVLQTLPSTEESLHIWDGLSKLATSESFYELKRNRPNTAPDVESTNNI